MKKIIYLIIAFIMTVTMSSVAFASTSLTVSGTGEIYVDADTAIVSLGIETMNQDVLLAQSQANEAMHDIVESLTEYGISKEDINTDYINIYMSRSYNNDDVETIYYCANSTLAIETSDMENIGEIIDIAFASGANTLNGISFSASDKSDVQDDAMRDAIKDAMNKANVMADMTGLKITGIEYISEGGTYTQERNVTDTFMLKNYVATEDASYGTEVHPAKISVSSNVTIQFSAE